ncbi:hypothetical protein ACFP1L_10735 [Lactiplantibacillus nangangensis]|uniref:ABC transporter permease n=1 Tax=Lactiplantibacillus nangangensis TaxID=2559917 RepID=A0ABW1SLC5_9LACO|nr:hypothetical protein [Lactiplantibacillus nangangensis]
MTHHNLQNLIWRQHWPILLVVVLGLFGLGASQGVSGSRAWSYQSAPNLIEAQVHYQKWTKSYVDATGRHYPSKAAFMKAYRADHLQLYRQHPSKSTGSTRGRFGTGINQNYFFLSLLVGSVMIWMSRRRFLNEFLQSLGYRRAAIYRQQSFNYVGAVAVGVIAGSMANLALMWLRIPAAYFHYFSWWLWLKDLTSDVLVASCLVILASLGTIVVNNILIVWAFGLVGYLWWWMPLVVIKNATTRLGADYLSRHWVIGFGLTLVLMGLAWGLAQWCATRYSAEQYSQTVLFNWCRLPLVVLLSIPLSVGLSRLFTGFIPGENGWPGLLLGWLLGLVGLIGWFYRPKWCQRLWQLVAQLR